MPQTTKVEQSKNVRFVDMFIIEYWRDYCKKYHCKYVCQDNNAFGSVIAMYYIQHNYLHTTVTYTK